MQFIYIYFDWQEVPGPIKFQRTLTDRLIGVLYVWRDCGNRTGADMSADTKIAELLTELHQLIKQTQVRDRCHDDVTDHLLDVYSVQHSVAATFKYTPGFIQECGINPAVSDY